MKIPNAIVIGIGGEVSGLDKSLRQMKRLLGQVDQMARSVNSALAPLNQAIKQQATLSQAATQQLAGQAKALQAVGQQAKQLNQQMQPMRQQQTQLDAFGKSLKAIFLGYVAPRAMLSFGKEVVLLSADMERITARFEVFTGSVDKAKRVIGELRQLSSATGISLSGLAKGASTLMGYGVGDRQALKAIKSMSAITLGDQDALQRMSVAYAQAMGLGKLQRQEVLQFVNAGWNPLPEIAKNLGKDMQQLNDMMKAGALGAEHLEKALQSVTSGTGRFAGMYDKFANTNAGRIARMANEWEQLKTAIGDSNGTLTRLATTDLNTALAGMRRMFSGHSGGEWDLFGKNELTQLQEELAELEELSRASEGFFGSIATSANSFFAGLSGNMTKDEWPKRIAEIKARIAELEKLADDRAALEKATKQDDLNQLRVDSVYGEASEKQFDSLIDSFYGSKADRVKYLREQSVEKERESLDTLIKSNASFERLLAASNKYAQEQDAILAKMQSQTAELEKQAKREAIREKFTVDRQDLLNELAYRQDLLTTTKEQARVLKLIRENGFSENMAKQVQAVERDIEAVNRLAGLTEKAKELAKGPHDAEQQQLADLQVMQQLQLIGGDTFQKEVARIRRGLAANVPEIGLASTNAVQSQNQFKMAIRNSEVQERLVDVALDQKAIMEKIRETMDLIKENVGIM